MYSAQGIFHHHFQCKKKCALYSIKYGTGYEPTWNFLIKNMIKNNPINYKNSINEDHLKFCKKKKN